MVMGKTLVPLWLYRGRSSDSDTVSLDLGSNKMHAPDLSLMGANPLHMAGEPKLVHRFLDCFLMILMINREAPVQHFTQILHPGCRNRQGVVSI